MNKPVRAKTGVNIDGLAVLPDSKQGPKPKFKTWQEASIAAWDAFAERCETEPQEMEKAA